MTQDDIAALRQRAAQAEAQVARLTEENAEAGERGYDQWQDLKEENDRLRVANKEAEREAHALRTANAKAREAFWPLVLWLENEGVDVPVPDALFNAAMGAIEALGHYNTPNTQAVMSPAPEVAGYYGPVPTMPAPEPGGPTFTYRWSDGAVLRDGVEVEPEAKPPGYDLVAHIARQREFSKKTFGPGARTQGVLDHIRKELVEIEKAPADLNEWVDVVLLALDGAWRAGHEPRAIAFAIFAKQTRNEARRWPDWRTADPDKAIEHVRADEPTCPAGHTLPSRTSPCALCEGLAREEADRADDCICPDKESRATHARLAAITGHKPTRAYCYGAPAKDEPPKHTHDWRWEEGCYVCQICGAGRGELVAAKHARERAVAETWEQAAQVAEAHARKMGVLRSMKATHHHEAGMTIAAAIRARGEKP